MVFLKIRKKSAILGWCNHNKLPNLLINDYAQNRHTQFGTIYQTLLPIKPILYVGIYWLAQDFHNASNKMIITV